MGIRRVGSVDLETGEFLDGAMVGVFYPKRQNGFREGWVAMAQGPLMALANANLGEQALRVLLSVIARLDFENFLLLSQADLAKALGMDRGDVSKALGKLEAAGVLVRGPKAGRSSTFRLNPAYGWKGSASNHQKALRARMEKAGLSVVDRDPNTVDAFTGKTDREAPPG